MLEAEKMIKGHSDETIHFYRYNVDNNRGIINNLNVWPIPHIFYFPLQWKGGETIVGYDKEPTPEAMKEWIELQF